MYINPQDHNFAILVESQLDFPREDIHIQLKVHSCVGSRVSVLVYNSLAILLKCTVSLSKVMTDGLFLVALHIWLAVTGKLSNCFKVYKVASPLHIMGMWQR